ncbi:MAG: glycosyltransferase [Sphingomonadales bacterium]|nr:glycosyltransferase [Sphingomonadales bacterium]
MSKGEIFYDLTEVLLAASGKARFHGIVRVVAEVGAQLAVQGPGTRFCVHSPAHDAFFEVTPRLNTDGSVDLGVPSGLRLLRLRRHFSKPRAIRDLALSGLDIIVRAHNRRVWARAGVQLPRLDLAEATYLNFGRPKLMLPALDTLRRAGGCAAFVPLLHDMMPLHDIAQRSDPTFSTNFLSDNRAVLRAATLIVANSAFTRDDILNFSRQGLLPPAPPVVAVPLVHECPEGSEPLEQPLPEVAPYLLTVGAATGRKNLEVLFEAALVLHARGAPVPGLCLAGALRKRTRDYLAQARFDPIRDRIVIRERPNQTDLVALYRNALALVIGSRMEGWGLPAGEALWLGTPAICSTAPVFREVCGELGLYFDPDDPAELAGIIAQLMSDTDFRETLRARIAAARPSLRDWARVAADIGAELEAAGLVPSTTERRDDA